MYRYFANKNRLELLAEKNNTNGTQTGIGKIYTSILEWKKKRWKKNLDGNFASLFRKKYMYIYFGNKNMLELLARKKIIQIEPRLE
jgi:hypothetical protein